MIKIALRQEWEAKPPKETFPLLFPVRSVVFKYTETEKCLTGFDCCKVVQGLQQTALAEGLPDIPFNFLVGGDLRIYEGRGWESYVFERKLVIAYIAHTTDNDPLIEDMSNLAFQFIKRNENKVKVMLRDENDKMCD